jgi:anthranilate phosphoribosyltransferase
MKYATTPRREIGIRTVFNILGPLTNPARAESQVIGVPSWELGSKIASVLHRLGTKHSLVVHGIDGIDEISITGKSLIWEVNQYEASSPYQISPQDFGFKEASLAEIKGGTPDENAEMLRGILGGEMGPRRDLVVMNAAAALVAGERVLDLREGTRLAEKVIDSGRASEKLDGLVRLSQSLG